MDEEFLVRLLLPGPTPVPEEVALRQARPMTDHRGQGFSRLRQDVERRLARLFGTQGQVVVLPASGTGGLEAAITNLLRPGERALAVVAGAFGQRWADQAVAMGVEVDRLEVTWGEAASPQEVAQRLADAPYRALLVTQNETSTGVLQDVEAMARLAHKVRPQALVLVDAVSGFPAVPLPMDAWGVDAVVVGSQKGFMLPPGLAMVALGPRAVERAREGGGLRAYFDLRPYLEGDLPYTPAVSLWYALDAALAQLEEEGQDRRLARHLLLRDMVRAGARALGLSPLAADPVASPTVTALVTPPGVSPDALRREALGLGVRLAGGLGPLRERVVRVGHVGAVAPADIPGALAALEVAWARLTGGGATGQAAAQAVTTWYAHVRFPSTQEVSP